MAKLNVLEIKGQQPRPRIGRSYIKVITASGGTQVIEVSGEKLIAMLKNKNISALAVYGD